MSHIISEILYFIQETIFLQIMLLGLNPLNIKGF